MKKIYDPFLLMDTHAWLWFIEEHPRLSSKVILDKIRRASEQEVLILSIISIWEIGLLVQNRKLVLEESIFAWVSNGIEHSKVIVKSLTIDSALNSASLPGTFHKDPADRVILATAIELGATIMTADEKMIAYAKEINVPVISI